MAFILEFVLLLAVICTLWMVKQRNRRKNMPPGEWGWPLIGYTRPPKEPMGDTLRRLQKKHGDTFTWQMGGRTYVYLCNFDTMKRVLNGPDVAVRPEFFSFKNFTGNKMIGIFNTSGEMWTTTRRFTMKHLKDLGLGKSSLEVGIEIEAKHLVEDFRQHINKPTNVPITLSVAILNVIWKMISDLRYDLNDPMIKRFQGMLIEIFEEFQGNVILFDAYPFLEKIVPRFMYPMIGISGYVDKSAKLLSYLKTVVEDHKLSIDMENPRDLIDEFIIEVKKEGTKSEAFSDENLQGTIADLFSNGSESTASTIRWILLYMAKYPEVQKKLQSELDAHVAKDRLPGVTDRDILDYTEAVFHEVQRLVSLIPMTFPRIPTKDIVIDGYDIPKNTIIVGNVEGCHMDPQFWERPNDFYPEHFIDQNGKFKNKKDGYAPFSLGRRICPGENLAKLNIFLFGSALLQNFSFAPAPGETLSTERDPDQTLIIMPKHFELIISERK